MMIALKVLVFMNKPKFFSFPFKNNFSKKWKRQLKHRQKYNTKQRSMEQQRAPQGTRDLFTKHKKDRKYSAWSIFQFKRIGRANKWKQELEEVYYRKRGRTFPR